MKFYVTEKQYALVGNALPVMESLYRNDPLPIFQLIEENYELDKGVAQKAADIVLNTHITSANKEQALRIDRLLSDWTLGASSISEEMFRYTIPLDNSQEKLLAKTLDVVSRIMMGQLHILFDALDMPAETLNNKHAMQVFQDVYLDGLHGAQEARDIVFPGIKELGWHGGYSIANRNVTESARLAYEMSKVLKKEQPLKVTDEPICRLQ